MSSHSLRSSRRYTNSPHPHSTTTDDLHRTSAPALDTKRSRNHQHQHPPSPQHQQHLTYSYRTRSSPFRSPASRTSSTRSPASSPLSRRKHGKMVQQPQTSHPDQSYPLYTSVDSAREMEVQSQPWMMATMIEDDDLTFGGKPLSTWYEEDRRRYSLGDESAPSAGYEEEEEEEQRGRQRDRPHYHHHHHHHHKSGHGHHKKSHHHKSHQDEKKH